MLLAVNMQQNFSVSKLPPARLFNANQLCVMRHYGTLQAVAQSVAEARPRCIAREDEAAWGSDVWQFTQDSDVWRSTVSLRQLFNFAVYACTFRCRNPEACPGINNSCSA